MIEQFHAQIKIFILKLLKNNGLTPFITPVITQGKFYLPTH